MKKAILITGAFFFVVGGFFAFIFLQAGMISPGELLGWVHRPSMYGILYILAIFAAILVLCLGLRYAIDWVKSRFSLKIEVSRKQ